MSAVIAAQQARKGVERRNEHEAEKKAQQKCVADAEKALKKLEKASTLEELEDAVRRGSRLKSYLPELEKALPAAKKKLEKLAGLSQGLSGAARVCWPEPHAPRSLVVPAQDERRRGVGSHELRAAWFWIVGRRTPVRGFYSHDVVGARS